MKRFFEIHIFKDPTVSTFVVHGRIHDFTLNNLYVSTQLHLKKQINISNIFVHIATIL